ncbi:MAG: hypothetical protein P4L50_10200 [Anaerolineaceae bacterium]|nr:hypothetical protein [Anaerolineaceae bacterium]
MRTPDAEGWRCGTPPDDIPWQDLARPNGKGGYFLSNPSGIPSVWTGNDEGAVTFEIPVYASGMRWRIVDCGIPYVEWKTASLPSEGNGFFHPLHETVAYDVALELSHEEFREGIVKTPIPTGRASPTTRASLPPPSPLPPPAVGPWNSADKWVDHNVGEGGRLAVDFSASETGDDGDYLVYTHDPAGNIVRVPIPPDQIDEAVSAYRAVATVNTARGALYVYSTLPTDGWTTPFSFRASLREYLEATSTPRTRSSSGGSAVSAKSQPSTGSGKKGILKKPVEEVAAESPDDGEASEEEGSDVDTTDPAVGRRVFVISTRDGDKEVALSGSRYVFVSEDRKDPKYHECWCGNARKSTTPMKANHPDLIAREARCCSKGPKPSQAKQIKSRRELKKFLRG